jgi:phenylpyruvate tautomerase PptA (4-oxalocrotonate tautomerase family)
MPIVDVQLVMPAHTPLPSGLTQELADSIGDLLDAPPGRVWVRLSVLPATHYAENRAAIEASSLPVFVRVLHAHSPQGPARQEQLTALTHAVAIVTGRPADLVHLEFAPDGAGRVAFGGQLVS